MITRPVVLVLGAGASMPYGYPVGSELRQQIIDELSNGSKGAHGQTDHEGVGLRKCLLANDFHESKLQEFAKVLTQSQTTSVDVFLERRPEFVELGKQAIAWILLQRDDKSRHIRQDDECWYHYLWELMEAPFDDFGNNTVTIVTYNYDLSFERHLFARISSLYGEYHWKSVAKFDEIKKIHVHGKVGNICQMHGFEDMLDCDIREAAKEIKIVHESDKTTQEYQKARRAIREAKEIHFLGFGYNKTNIERLLKNMPVSWHPDIYGTTYGMGAAEIEAAKHQIKSYEGTVIAGVDEERVHLNNIPHKVIDHMKNVFPQH